VDYAKHLIVCNSISPGKIETGRPGAGQDPALVENARRRTPWPRLGRPQDIANAAVFLGSNRATYINGHESRGGRRLAGRLSAYHSLATA